VKRPYVSRAFGHFIPKNKSTDDASVVTLCCRADESLHSVEKFGPGGSPISLYCECVYAPYRLGAESRSRVTSLLLATERHAARVHSWSVYQLEML